MDCGTKYCDFYLRQARGGNLDHFAGSPHVGTGLGNILGSLARTITPFMKSIGRSALKSAKKHAVNSSLQIATDLMSGSSLKETLKKRGRNALKGLGEDMIQSVTPHSAGGVRKKRRRTASKSRTNTKRRKIDRSEAY